MCGITGLWQRRGAPSVEALRSALDPMCARLAHRGPDGAGAWCDAAAGIALGHRRLAILDLSPAGHQPMLSHSGRYVLSLNGEIYNFAELRTRLDGVAWRGHSDTEVLLAAFDAWGIETALRRSVGMFALAVWDRQQRHLILARDRMGEKPLYYAGADDGLIFGSELKALRAYPAWRPSLDPAGIREFLRYGYIPTPGTIYTGCRKLPPGTYLCVTTPGLVPANPPQPYWSLRTAILNPPPPPPDEAAALDQLDLRLRQAVAGQMVADVPVGAFLSGGIDSSLVSALMQAQSSRPIRTFSIGFAEAEFDEAPFARSVARHLGTDHTEVYVSPQQALQVVPAIPEIYDEPFADSSQIPTCLICQIARRDVTVCLSGDGGDELMGGYPRYGRAERAWAACRAWPEWARRAAGALILQFARGAPLHPRAAAAEKLALFLRTSSDAVRHRSTLGQLERPEDLMLHPPAEPPHLTEPLPDRFSLVEDLMFLDAMIYLPDDILVKVDRASMAVSLETRVPLLDHRVVEFCWSLPLHWKRRAGGNKWLLRQLLARYVPPALFERPKMGFAVPLNSWLRGPLREWAGDLLAPDHLRRLDVLQPHAVGRMWRKHLQGADWGFRVWFVLTLTAWLDQDLSASGASMPVHSATGGA